MTLIGYTLPFWLPVLLLAFAVPQKKWSLIWPGLWLAGFFVLLVALGQYQGDGLSKGFLLLSGMMMLAAACVGALLNAAVAAALKSGAWTKAQKAIGLCVGTAALLFPGWIIFDL